MSLTRTPVTPSGASTDTRPPGGVNFTAFETADAVSRRVARLRLHHREHPDVGRG